MALQIKRSQLRRSLKRTKMWIRSNLPLTVEALAHGEFFLRDITDRMLTAGHGFGKGGMV